MALWVLGSGKQKAADLSKSLQEADTSVHACEQCGFYTEAVLCPACEDVTRNRNQICVVEQASDVLPIENCGIYHGLYHCLGGKLSPLNDIEPEDLRIGELIAHVKTWDNGEVILALGSDVEGEATAHYLSHLLQSCHCRITRLAQGLPAGSGLGYADTLTLTRAFTGRTESL